VTTHNPISYASRRWSSIIRYIFTTHRERFTQFTLRLHQALKAANVSDPSKCLFVDDSRANVDAAHKLGWGRCVHFREDGVEAVVGGQAKQIGDIANGLNGFSGDYIPVINDLQQLRVVWSDIFDE